ncbi:MAG: NrsF family protein [Alphaproteobacteria bacterium]
MRTDQLIDALVADSSTLQAGVGRAVAAALPVGLFISVAFLLIGTGLRPDIADALGTWRFNFKLVVTLILAVSGAFLMMRASRPGAEIAAARMLVFAAPILLGLAVIVELTSVPAGSWAHYTIGTNALHCLLLIPTFSAPMLVALMIALRHGAPTSPGLAGIAASLMASGFGAAIYALQCTDDSPLFLAVWYVAAISILVVCGRTAGRRFLNW